MKLRCRTGPPRKRKNVEAHKLGALSQGADCRRARWGTKIFSIISCANGSRAEECTRDRRASRAARERLVDDWPSGLDRGDVARALSWSAHFSSCARKEPSDQSQYLYADPECAGRSGVSPYATISMFQAKEDKVTVLWVDGLAIVAAGIRREISLMYRRLLVFSALMLALIMRRGDIGERRRECLERPGHREQCRAAEPTPPELTSNRGHAQGTVWLQPIQTHRPIATSAGNRRGRLDGVEQVFFAPRRFERRDATGYLLDLQLFQEKKLLLETEAKLSKRSPLVIRGPQVGDGQLLLLLVVQ